MMDWTSANILRKLECQSKRGLKVTWKFFYRVNLSQSLLDKLTWLAVHPRGQPNPQPQLTLASYFSPASQPQRKVSQEPSVKTKGQGCQDGANATQWLDDGSKRERDAGVKR